MNKQIGNRLAELRNAKSFSQEQVAKIIGISRQKYVRIEKGIDSVTLETLEKLANVFNVNIKDITKVLEQKTRAEEQNAETDNIEDAIENDLLFYDNVYDAQMSLEAFGFTVEEL